MAELSKEDEIALNNFLERRKALIISLQKSKGLIASGYSAKLLHVRHDTFERGDTFNLVDASGYFEQQEYGRGPGGIPSFRKIYEWVGLRKYGIDYANNKERISISWAIMMKIKKHGTHTHIQRKQTGVLEEAIARKETGKLLREISKNRTLEILTDIKRIYA